MKYCPFCGADLIEGAVSFCAECGKPLSSTRKLSTSSNISNNMVEIYFGDTLNSSVYRNIKDITYTPSGNGNKTNVTATLVIGGTDEFGDYSGPITIKLKPEMLSDNAGNKSDGLTYTTTKIVDFIKPTVEISEQSNVAKTADSVQYTIVVRDKYLDTKTENDISKDTELEIKVGNEDVTSKITKALTYTSTDEGRTRTYTLTLSNFKALGLSGNVYVKVKDGAIADTEGNTNNYAECYGTALIDTIPPEFKYEYSSVNPTNPTTSGDYGSKKLTVVFSVEDKFFTGCSLDNSSLGVQIDGKDVSTTQRSLSSQDIPEYCSLNDFTKFIKL